MGHLTGGNTAKLYCLNWIESYIQAHGQEIRILDLGSGTSSNFVALLKRYPQIKYIGIEPSSSACKLARQALLGTNAEIIHSFAYDVMGRLIQEPVDIVVSFSVLEHVVQRQKFLESAAACMGENSVFLINYDAGHFVYPSSVKERIKNIVGPLLALVGNENYYQKFVKETDFRKMVAASGLKIQEAKFFNTQSKGIHKLVPTEKQDEHLQAWLDYELYLNDLGIEYQDKHAKYWVSRNFILEKA